DLMRATSSTSGAGTLGLEWAAFMLGVPSTVSVDTNDTYYATTPRHNVYAQDNFRVNSRLMLNLGFRFEYEGSIRERFNRGLGGFDASFKPLIADAARAAYAANPLPEVPASAFNILGGSQYLGVNNVPATLTNPTYQVMPRFGFAYSVDSKTVLRG